MNIKVCNRDIVVGLVAAVVGAAISSTIVPASVIVQDDVAYNMRDDRGSVQRDTDTELREQARRVKRLQELREEEKLHGSAEDEAPEVDAMTHYQAYLYCRRLGFTRTRFHSCITTVLETGSYQRQ